MSIAQQDIDVDIYVVDDGSDPPITLDSSLNGKPIHLIRLNRNGGITQALNEGLGHILQQPYRYISRHDCGDLDHPDRLRLQQAYLEAHPDVALVGTSVTFQEPNGKRRFDFRAPQDQQQIMRKMRYSAALVHSSCMFRADSIRQMGGYSAEYPHAEDYELFFRMLEGHQLRNLGAVLVTASYNKMGISIRNRRRSLMSRLAVQWRYADWLDRYSYLGLLQTLFLIVTPYRLVSRIKSLLKVE